MHGCAETDDGPRPFLHTMGPADHFGTMAYGLSRGHRFGIVGSTDHHSAHPGSYGHGLTGVWSERRDRVAIWEAIMARRTWSMTGDRVDLGFSVDQVPMGGTIEKAGEHSVEIDVEAGSAIDCVDVIRDGTLIKRFSQYDIGQGPRSNAVNTKIALEVGWGPRNSRYDWDGMVWLTSGKITSVESRFRGREIVSPTDSDTGEPASSYQSSWKRQDDSSISFTTVTHGNPTNSTPATQMICLSIEVPKDARLCAAINGRNFDIPIKRLIAGAVAEPMADMPATSIRFHRAPLPHEWQWHLSMNDSATQSTSHYYTRVRLQNGHFAWASPVFVDA